ncbi:PREDICTED: Retrovirus-related Pol poly from transposon, partial [Prunus dulcis]
PDLAFAVNQVCQHMHNPRESHLAAVKRILRYIQGTMDYGIEYQKGNEAILIRYCDSDWSGSQDDMK